MKQFLILLFSILLCSCSISYKQAKSPTGIGYFDTLLQQDVYEITYTGDYGDNANTIYDFALLRASESCLENGYKTFDIINNKDNTTTEVSSIPIGNYYNSYSMVISETAPKIVLIIKCSKENKLTFVAEQIKENLRKKYNLNKNMKADNNTTKK